MAKKIKKGQSGFSSAGVLDDTTLDIIPELMGNVKRPNLMGDPTKLGTENLGPLLAMMAAGTYPAVSAMTDKEGKLRDRGIIVPPEGLSDEEKERLGLDGKPRGIEPSTYKPPISTGGPPPEKVEFQEKFPLPDPPTFEDMVPGGGIRPAEGVPDMSIMTMADQKKKEDTSKAVVPTKMMESFEDLPEIGQKFVDSKGREGTTIPFAPRFSQTEDYIKSNYTGNEKKLINDWVNELFSPNNGLILELRDTGIAAQLEQLNQADPKRKVTSKELLEVVQAADNQLAESNFKVMGQEQELFPQTLQVSKNNIRDLNIVMRPGQVSDFLERYKNLVFSNLDNIENVSSRNEAVNTLRNIETQTQTLLNEEKIDPSILAKNREFSFIQDNLRQVQESLQRTVFTDEHMYIGLPGTKADDYSVITHNFKPIFGQSKKTPEHNPSHPAVDHTVAFSRARKIQNYENADNGTVIMEIQSDLHREMPNITYPSSTSDFKASENFYPYGGGAQYWVKQVMKDRLTQALIDGDDFLGWVPGEVVSVYEQADYDNYVGFKNIYNKKTNEFIKRINKDITKRGKALGMSEDQIEKATLKIKNNGQYKFDRGDASKYFEKVSEKEYPGLENYVRNVNGKLQLINMPYIDLKPREDFDPELLKKIGLPQFKKGGKTKSTKADPLIDIEIFFESI